MLKVVICLGCLVFARVSSRIEIRFWHTEPGLDGCAVYFSLSYVKASDVALAVH